MAKILIIDDSAVMRDLLSDYLSDSGHLVDVSADGKDGLEKALRNSYDVCICDMHMPGLNGYDVLSAIRPKKPDLQLIFTDSLPDQLSEKVQEAGPFHLLKKPFELEQLREIIEKLLMPIRLK